MNLAPNATTNTSALNEYQYHLKDHLGNVRVSFTTQKVIDNAVATFETANATSESNSFLRYNNARRVNATLFDHTHTGTTAYSERLSGSANEKVGIARSISVMPGDTVKMEVYAKYVDASNSTNTTALTTLLAQIAAGTATAGTVVDGSGYSSSTTSFPYGSLFSKGSSTGAGPKAYLNWLVFDRNFVFVNAGYVSMSTVAKENGSNVPHEKLSGQAVISQPGYVYVYLSNENPTPIDVYFDDFKVTQIKSPVVQQSDYYPFGLTFNAYQRENSIENKYLYNQGAGEKKFKTERVYDLGLNVDESKYRTYDYITGRWWQVDPKADEGNLVELTPYNYSYNNPILKNDPEGDCPLCGAVVGAAVDYGTQVASNYLEGRENVFTDNINLVSIGTAAAEGFLTSGGSVVKNVGLKLSVGAVAAVINNTVEVTTDKSAENGLSVSVEKDAGNVVKKAAVDVVSKSIITALVPGAKAIQGRLSSQGFNAGSLSKTVKQGLNAVGVNVNKTLNQTIKTGSEKIVKGTAQGLTKTIQSGATAVTNEKTKSIKEKVTTN